jgi:hypothetical protein
VLLLNACRIGPVCKAGKSEKSRREGGRKGGREGREGGKERQEMDATSIDTTTNLSRPQVSYEKVRVLYRFNTPHDDELELERGDIVYVMGKGADGWAYGA